MELLKSKFLPYSEAITAKEIINYLNSKENVLILEDFLGNYNDIELLSIIRRYPGKKIFLTMEYDRTVAYLPEELFAYCRYINFNNISEFFLMNEIDEDPSEVREVLTKAADRNPERRTLRLFTEIASQLGFSKFFINSNLRDLDSEDTMALVLLFSVIPLSIERFESNPFAASKRLRSYAGLDGMCKFKDLMMRWFDNDQ